jgi:hypothetical protein
MGLPVLIIVFNIYVHSGYQAGGYTKLTKLAGECLRTKESSFAVFTLILALSAEKEGFIP